MAANGFFSPRSSSPIFLGVGLVVTGVLLILVTWFKIAELVLVPAQFPLLVSGGLTGIVLVLVGLTMVNVHVKRQESAKRIAAINRLAKAVSPGGIYAPDPSDAPDAPVPAAETDDDGWEKPAIDPAKDPTDRISRSVWE